MSVVNLMDTAGLAVGVTGVLLGAAALWIPKSGASLRWHRQIGLCYLATVAVLAVLVAHQAIFTQSWGLLALTIGTVLLSVYGWRVIALRHRAARQRERSRVSALLIRHIRCMGAGYAGVWMMFGLASQPFGSTGRGCTSSRPLLSPR